MGVKGLSSYIEEYLNDVLEWHKLHNCNVIIDGNNLAHVLYRECPEVNAAFGGDYDTYATYVREYFEKIHSCEVHCIVLMDGGQPLDSRKFRTVRERTLGQIKGCLHVKPGNQSTFKIFPCMARQVFVSVLKSMDIPVYQTDFEADLEIATVAVKYGLTVISSDSDFYIYNVKHIRLDSICHKKVFKNKTDDYNYLPCKSFNLEKFCKATGMDALHMPLLATLLGNDYIVYDYFTGFYSVLSKDRKRSKHMSDRHNTIRNVIAWLAKQKGKPTEHIIKKITKHTSAPRMTRKIRRSIANYTALKSNLVSYIQNSIATSNPGQRCSSELSTLVLKDGEKQKFWKDSAKIETDLVLKGGEKLPNWFMKAYRLHCIPHEVADIMTQKYFISPPHVEVEQMSSSYMLVKPIVKSVFTMLWQEVLEFTDVNNALKVPLLEGEIPVSESETHEMDSEVHLERGVHMMEHGGIDTFESDTSDVVVEDDSEGDQEIAKDEEEILVSDRVSKIVSETKVLKNTNNFIQSVLPDRGPLKSGSDGNNKKGKGKKNEKQKLQLSWFMRKGRDLKNEVIHILPDSVLGLPSISDVSNMTLLDKKAVVLVILSSSSSIHSSSSSVLPCQECKGMELGLDCHNMDMPADMELILTFIIYWIRNTKLCLKENHTLAVLMCVFMFYIIDGKIGRVRARKMAQELEGYRGKLLEIQGSEGYLSETAGVKQLLAHISMEECLLANSKLLKFHQMNSDIDDRTYNKKIVHAFSEYQVCIYFVQLLNSLLGTPFPMLSVECLWGGTFCYNIFIHLKKTSNPLMVVSKLLGIGTCLEMLFLKLFRRLGEALNFQKTADMVDPVASRSVSKVKEKKKLAKAGGMQKLVKSFERQDITQEEKNSKISSKRKHAKRETSGSQVIGEEDDVIRAKKSRKKERTYALNNRFADLIIDSDDDDDNDEEDGCECG